MKNAKDLGFVTGHGFSRAANRRNNPGLLAPADVFFRQSESASEEPAFLSKSKAVSTSPTLRPKP
jgi:hypothetical protein